MGIFINPKLFVGLLVDIAILAYFAYEDAKHLSVGKRISYVLEALAIMAGIAQFILIPEQAFIMLVFGGAVFFAARKYYRKLFAELDNEMSLITLVNATYIALPAMLLVLAWTAITAYINKNIKKIDEIQRFPAMTVYAIAWLICIAAILLSLI